MKKKLFIAVSVLLAAWVVLLFTGPLTFRITRNVSIGYPIYDVAAQFTDLRNWRNWHPALRGKDSSDLLFSGDPEKVNSSVETKEGTRFTLTAINPAGIVFKETSKGKTIYHSLIAYSDSIGRTCRISGIRYTGVWDWLKEKMHPQNKIFGELTGLKQFMEDPLAYYGFPIGIIPVTDTLILTRQAVVPAGEINRQIRQSDSDLAAYADVNKLTGKPYRYVSRKDAGQGRFSVAVGIAVNKRAPDAKGMKFLELPAQGRLLAGRTTGGPARLKALFASMEKYMKDKGLKRVADPLEKYEHLPGPDTTHFDVEVQIPIY
jgi:predicted transcriptional regulator YdeE